MSWPLAEWLAGSPDGLPLTESDCLLLLDTDLINIDGDLLRSFPCPAAAAAKLEAEVCGGGGGAAAEDDGGAGLLYPPSPLDLKPSRAQLASDLLHQLDNQCKSESFPSWLEEKVDLPIFEAIPVPALGVERAAYSAPAPPPPPPPPPAHLHRSDTAELLREFESVYSDVELTHLTPPQSPPGPATQLLLTYAQHAGAAPAWPLAPATALPPSPRDLALEREMAVVEELMRHGAAQLASPAAASPPSSPAPSTSACSSSDDEWARSPRGKPYSRGPDDRRTRKKEQNKNAATRYRQKKKAEVEVLLSEESGLRQRHGELDTKCADLQREIRYLKGLMRDLFKAKGLIK